jgi:hypothetical protein
MKAISNSEFEHFLEGHDDMMPKDMELTRTY